MKIYFLLTLNKERVFIQILFCICLNYIKNVYSKKYFFSTFEVYCIIMIRIFYFYLKIKKDDSSIIKSFKKVERAVCLVGYYEQQNIDM